MANGDFQTKWWEHGDWGNQHHQDRGPERARTEDRAELLDGDDRAGDEGTVADGAGDRRPGDRRGDRGQGQAGSLTRVGLATAIVPEVDCKVTGRRHRQDNDLSDQWPSREGQFDVEARQYRLRRQPDHPAGDHGDDRPPKALNRRQRHHADQDHADHGQTSAVDLDRREAVGQKHGRADDRRPAELVPRRELVGRIPKGRNRLDHVVLGRLLQPDHHRGGRPTRVNQCAEKKRMFCQAFLECGQCRRVGTRGLDRSVDGHRVGLQVDILDGSLGRLQGRDRGRRKEAG